MVSKIHFKYFYTIEVRRKLEISNLVSESSEKKEKNLKVMQQLNYMPLKLTMTRLFLKGLYHIITYNKIRALLTKQSKAKQRPDQTQLLKTDITDYET